MSAPVSLELIAGLLLFAAVFIPLERRFPIHRQRSLRRGWSTDLIYYTVGCFVGHLSDGLSMSAMLLIRQATHLDFGHLAAGQPYWLQFIEIVLMADFLAYVFHRALHQVPFLWRLHRVHHTPEHMDWLANVHLHPVDKILGDCFQFTPIFLMGFSTTPMFIYTIVLAFQGFLNHSKVNVNFGPLRFVFASPVFHHWHHANDPKHYNKNFAPHLAIFDLLFGTAHIPAGNVMPERYGIPDNLPEDFLGQMAAPVVAPLWTEPAPAEPPLDRA
jgi:sterol desaturase/sphingolipid hydroxylase (fatty acid hydroxylase superfamily)